MKFEFKEYNVIDGIEDKSIFSLIYEDGTLTYNGKTIHNEKVIEDLCSLIESHKDEIIKLSKVELSSYKGGRQQEFNVKFEDTDELQIVGSTPIKEMSLLYYELKNNTIYILEAGANYIAETQKALAETLAEIQSNMPKPTEKEVKQVEEEQKFLKDVFDYEMSEKEKNKLKELNIDSIIEKVESPNFHIKYAIEGDEVAYILIEKGDFNVHRGQMTHYFVHSMTSDPDKAKFEILRWYLENNQEELQKIFDYEMTEEEANKIVELNVNDMLGKVITPTFRIKYINQDVSGYYFISKGYVILEDGTEPTHYFLNNLIFDADKAKDEIELLYGNEIKGFE